MAERSAIVELWRSQEDVPAVLATLVRVEGSSYRRPGARMYIQSAGYVGAISGGCLEAEIARKATWLTRDGAAIKTYSTLFENPFDNTADCTAFMDTDDVPYGLGCGGVLDVLLEPVGLPETNAMLRVLEAAQHGKIFYSVTALPARECNRAVFARLILREDHSIFFSSDSLDEEMQTSLASLARRTTQTDSVSIALNGETRTAFLEPILPPQRLVVVGAGEDARPLVRMAHLLGWRVAVADGRGWLVQPARFLDAEQVLALDQNAGNLHDLHLTAYDAVAMLTHSLEQDRILLGKLLPLELRYLGLLGARARSQLLLTQAAQQLGWTPEECLRRVHAPIGLDLGGDSPEAVALTIVAEIQSILHRKDAAHRRMSEEAFLSIPERPYILASCPLDQYPTDEIHPSADATHKGY